MGGIVCVVCPFADDERLKNVHVVIVFYLLVLHFVTCLKTCHFTACLTSLWTSISVFYVNTARDVVTVLLLFAKCLSLSVSTYTFSHAHAEAHTHKHTRIISTQEEWRQPDTGAWLRGEEERPLLETKALHTHKKGEKKGGGNVSKKPLFTSLEKKIRAHRAFSKATRLFLTK